jgi:hypothetical protein
MSTACPIYCSKCNCEIPTDGMIMYLGEGAICRTCSQKYQVYTNTLNTNNTIPISKTYEQIREVIRIVNDPERNSYLRLAFATSYNNAVFETLMWVIGELPDEDFLPLAYKNTKT